MMRIFCLAAICLTACAEPVPDPDGSAGATARVTYVGPDKAAAMAQQAGLTVLDIRTPEEYSAGAIPGSVNIDWKRDDFAEALGGLDRDAPLLVHCESGGRSTAALEVLEDEGFTDVRHLDGGMRAWRAAGLPTE